MLTVEFNSLIKSGGGTGPVKPGNLRMKIHKVLIPAEFSER